MAVLKAMVKVVAMVVLVVDLAGSSLSRLQRSPFPPPDLQLPVGHHGVTVARQGVALDMSYTAKKQQGAIRRKNIEFRPFDATERAACHSSVIHIANVLAGLGEMQLIRY